MSTNRTENNLRVVERELRPVHLPSSRDAGYRRLAVTMLGLDVATLAAELGAARLGEREIQLAA